MCRRLLDPLGDPQDPTLTIRAADARIPVDEIRFILPLDPHSLKGRRERGQKPRQGSG